MPSDMAHERMRWTQMGTNQLLTRLRRITRAEKLRNFASLALESGDQRLIDECFGRAGDLGYESIQRYIENNETRERRPTMEEYTERPAPDRPLIPPLDPTPNPLPPRLQRQALETSTTLAGPTGRVSSFDPPMQALPRKIKMGKKEPITRRIRFGRKKDNGKS